MEMELRMMERHSRYHCLDLLHDFRFGCTCKWKRGDLFRGQHDDTQKTSLIRETALNGGAIDTRFTSSYKNRNEGSQSLR